MIDEPSHRTRRESIGSYVIGHLGPDESRFLENHLSHCAECRAEVTGLRPVADALAASRTGISIGPAEPSPALLNRIEERLRFERGGTGRSRQGRTLRTGALAVLAGAAAAAVVVLGLRLTEARPAPAVPLEAVDVASPVGGVDASADLVDHTWGIEVKLQATGLEPGARYVVTVMSADGAEHDAGAFIGTGDNPIQCNLNAGVLRGDASSFVVRDDTGSVVLRSTFPT